MSEGTALGPERQKNHAGFTIVELLIVVVILAIIAGGVVVAYDGLQKRSESEVTLSRLNSVREALLKFRADMGFFPGEAALASINLNLSNYNYIDGENPTNQNPSAEVRRAWADHELNFWMLFEKPIDQADAQRWTWRKEISRGWNGPYLNTSLGFRLDGVGLANNNFIAGPRLNRLLAVADAYTNRVDTPSAFLQWVQEDRTINDPGQPAKQIRNRLGRPIAFIKDTTSVVGMAIYFCVSAGPDGRFDFIGPDFGDDVRVEVARERLQ